MVAPHASQQASGFTRMLSVLTLIAGIAAMHVGIFTTPAAAHHLAASAVDPGSHSATRAAVIDHTTGTQAAVIDSASAARPASIDSASEFLATPSAEPGCADCGDSHAGLHACVFILTAFALAVLLVALYRISSGQPADGGGPKPRHWRPRRERPPPWTVLSLAELSILRI
ncbi:hypothetical protein [Nocardia xishanensis]|uniref:Uncharacterized protein n=1 Tax=Nocardia xishanensis TaxID=238964 RepID=A0ABW7WYP5_9NOCA